MKIPCMILPHHRANKLEDYRFEANCLEVCIFLLFLHSTSFLLHTPCQSPLTTVDKNLRPERTLIITYHQVKFVLIL